MVTQIPVQLGLCFSEKASGPSFHGVNSRMARGHGLGGAEYPACQAQMHGLFQRDLPGEPLHPATGSTLNRCWDDFRAGLRSFGDGQGGGEGARAVGAAGAWFFLAPDDTPKMLHLSV